jgi:two-component system NarL family response regulator
VRAPLRIGIADDHRLFREGLKSLLTVHPELLVTTEIEHADDIASAIAASPCDILLLDLQMERSSLGDIATLPRALLVIVVTASEHPADAIAAIRAGARAVVFKRFAVKTLMDAITAVAAGQVWLPPTLQTHLAASLREPVDVLTPREREIARLVALGLRNAEVARQLHISPPTVKSHLNNVFQKLGVRDRVELALYAIRAGIVGFSKRK